MGADAAEYWVDSHGNLRTTAFEIGGNRALHIKGASGDASVRAAQRGELGGVGDGVLGD